MAVWVSITDASTRCLRLWFWLSFILSHLAPPVNRGVKEDFRAAFISDGTRILYERNIFQPKQPFLTGMTLRPPKREQLFFSRDESWLRFNGRVLQEAEDPSNPLLERVKFLAITASNLDEFVEIRVAGVMQRIEDGYNEAGPDGLTPEQTFDRDTSELRTFVESQYRCWNESLRPALHAAGIRVLDYKDMTGEQLEHASQFYQREVDPLLTPITIDPAHPFPRVLNKALCLALLLRSKRKSAAGPVLGVVTVPRALPRLVPVPSAGGTIDYIFLHELIEAHAARMYRGYEVLATAAFRVTRNSNLYLQEEETRSLLESVRTELHNRRKGDAVRLEVEEGADPDIIDRLRVNFEVDESQVVRTDGPVNLSRVMTLYTDTPRPDLKYAPFVPRELRLNRRSANIFEEIQHRDILLHHPYDSYDGVVSFIEAAAEDPAVLSMKQTLYRTSADSPMFTALIEAAQSKEVTVVVELMARFDEASNIRWARNLEDAGVQVFHGIVGLKTHCKLALMVRRDEDGVTRRYAHLGTGNYNPNTARFYDDISLLTCDPAITASMQAVFNYLTAHSESDDYSPLLVAPLTLAEQSIQMIRRETDHARKGRPARIIAKMNALVDPMVIRRLYAASQAGVEIDLLVRGICCLRPGVPGVSERIRVTSIVGRFLEHSRVFAFGAGDRAEVYLSSADWMPRNFIRRIEAMFPVEAPELRARLLNEVLGTALQDNVKAHRLTADGSYVRVPTTDPPVRSQMVLLEAARRAAQIRVVEPVIRHAAAPDVVESIRAAAVL
jgi:polyphosphate kinase